MTVKEASDANPGIWRYALAVVLLAVAVFGFLVAAESLRSPASEIAVVTVPGESTILLDADDYLIFAEVSAGDDRAPLSEDPPELDLTITAVAGGKPVEVGEPESPVSYEDAGRSGRAIAAFSVEESGSYRLVADYPEGVEGPDVTLGVGYDIAGGAVSAAIFAGLGVLALFGAHALGWRTFSKRRRVKKEESRTRRFDRKPAQGEARQPKRTPERDPFTAGKARPMQTASRKWSPGELLKGASEALSPVYINIATDNDIYCAGDTVSAKVQVDVEKPCVVEQGTISLRYCWGYEYTSDNDTHYHESHSVVAQRSILQGRLLSPGQPVLEEFSGLIPADAQPTVLGLGVQVRWEVNVVVKVPGVDGKASLNLVVLSPQIEPPEPSPQSETGRFESHEIQVKVDRSTVRRGETVEGTVVVIPRTDLKARSIDLSLVYREKVSTGSYWSWSYPVAIDLRLADRPDPLPLGSRKAYPFVVQVPTSAFPSLQTDDFKTYWTLTAKVNRRFRRDEKVELPIHVQTVPAEVPLGEAPGGLA